MRAAMVTQHAAGSLGPDLELRPHPVSNSTNSDEIDAWHREVADLPSYRELLAHYRIWLETEDRGGWECWECVVCGKRWRRRAGLGFLRTCDPRFMLS